MLKFYTVKYYKFSVQQYYKLTNTLADNNATMLNDNSNNDIITADDIEPVDSNNSIDSADAIEFSQAMKKKGRANIQV